MFDSSRQERDTQFEANERDITVLGKIALAGLNLAKAGKVPFDIAHRVAMTMWDLQGRVFNRTIAASGDATQSPGRATPEEKIS